ncbi:MAG: outer membrane lipoprotein carrier protein LolA [Endomicrobia bacterium]|nr:outer membrane lipoprotein carrier protein LolA [Endomicrobiia bacterium]
MKKLSVIFAFLFMAGLGINVSAQKSGEARLNDILSKMEAADKKIKTLEVGYTQEIFYSATNEKQNISGNLKYKKPSSVFIVQKTPQEQRIYIDGKKITIYTPENSQAVMDNWKNVINGDMAPASLVSFGSNWKTLKKDNVINYAGEDEKNYILELYPAAKKEWSMKMYVSKESLYPQKAVVTASGLTVNVTLSNYKINQEFKKDIFKFEAPAGVEVIKLN